MMYVTLFVLFGTDLKLLHFPTSSDATFTALNTLSFWLFLLEIVLNSWAKTEFFQPNQARIRGYFGSFFFFLDLAALWSITLEIPWLASATGQEDLLEETGGIRVVRMIRLVRLVKLYKITSQRRKEKKMLEDLELLIEEGRMDADEIDNYKFQLTHHQQSKVGTDLVDMITRKVITMILLMLLMVPLLTYELDPAHFRHSTTLVHAAVLRCARPSIEVPDCTAVTSAVREFAATSQSVGIAAEYPFTLLHLTATPDRCGVETTVFDYFDTGENPNGYEGFVEGAVRREFVHSQCVGSTSSDGSTSSSSDGVKVCSVFDVSADAKAGAEMSIYLTIFVIVILITMAIAFESDAQTLILTPIEKMMELINMVADDPLEEFDFGKDDLGTGGEGRSDQQQQYELKVVVLAIQKITALLRIGFGEAGAEIISKNMSVEAGTMISSSLDPMIPGKRMYAIFGFCDIHEFDMCTEVLTSEIMTFVNSVARIVHEQVSRWGGTCNKNLGNAFLMVWRIGDEEDLVELSMGRKRAASRIDGGNSNHAAVNLKRVPGLDELSDKALVGFLKVVIEINRDRQVLAYRSDPRLRSGAESYTLRMGFGLHAGWGIEGAVGSLQKVDATYLSPHVNMSARMEAASRQFGVAVLMTESFHELMSPEAQATCRRLDIVTVKGSAQPMPIWTYDTHQDQVFPELKAPKNVDLLGLDLSLTSLLNKQAESYTPASWSTDQDLLQLRRLATPVFTDKFKEGVNCYLTSNWSRARVLLEECDSMMLAAEATGGDGPSRTLLDYMRNRAWTCPEDWKGFRPLTSK